VLVAQGRTVRIIVEEIDVWAPAEPHLETRRQLGPRLWSSQTGFRPVMLTHQLRHLSIADEYLLVTLGRQKVHDVSVLIWAVLT
jgi:hypothetical protein